MVEELSTTVAYPALSNCILPGTLRGCAFRLYAAGLQQFDYFCSELCISIEDCVLVGMRIRKHFSQLLHYPGTGRIVGDIEMEDLPPAVFDDKEAVQDSESESRDGKEVHSRNSFTMIAQESGPEVS